MQIINEEDGGLHRRHASPSVRERNVPITPQSSAPLHLPGYGTSAIVAMDKTATLPSRASVSSGLLLSKSLDKGSDRSLESVLNSSKEKVSAIESLLRGLDLSSKHNSSTVRSSSLDLGMYNFFHIECEYIYFVLIWKRYYSVVSAFQQELNFLFFQRNLFGLCLERVNYYFVTPSAGVDPPSSRDPPFPLAVPASNQVTSLSLDSKLSSVRESNNRNGGLNMSDLYSHVHASKDAGKSSYRSGLMNEPSSTLMSYSAKRASERVQERGYMEEQSDFRDSRRYMN